MTDLIQRLEQASAGSREADANIELSRRTFLYGAAAMAGWVANPSFGDGVSAGWLWNEKERDLEQAPFYTTSLDAARSIVNWVLLSASDIAADGLAMVTLGNPATTPALEVHGIHSSLEIAWCIASLKAIQAEKE